MKVVKKEESCIYNDPELCLSESKIKQCLGNIEKEMGCNGLICFIYNPLKKGGEIIDSDHKHIATFLYGIKLNQATLLLHGPGGDFNEGLRITYIIRKRFHTYRTFVPRLCASALCLPVLKSDKLILLKGGQITQVDPHFLHKGKWHRAIEHLQDKDPEIKNKANLVFRSARKDIFDLIKEKPSLFDHEKHDFEHIDEENIIDAMLNREEHSDKVKEIAFEYIPFKVRFIDNKKLTELCDFLIQEVTDYLIVTDRRYCIGSTYPTTINEHLPDKKMVGNLLFSP